MHCDLLLMLGIDYPYIQFLPRKGAVIEVDEWARVLGRRTRTALGVIGSVRPAVNSTVHWPSVRDEEFTLKERCSLPPFVAQD